MLNGPWIYSGVSSTDVVYAGSTYMVYAGQGRGTVQTTSLTLPPNVALTVVVTP